MKAMYVEAPEPRALRKRPQGNCVTHSLGRPVPGNTHVLPQQDGKPVRRVVGHAVPTRLN